ncbi:unnamed protein product [Ostreobium quekettii]|uniref:Quinolinate phosphoribosyl transferase C-terminal domain-containing protein n=1 Tax=Ostreobium quekettii TaxID=121088 RepID=A0A8S1IR49_9CHLO|nr:unnamed protein product [Ostreobium quekettii]|eukprot:evm.model.scf_76.17 EVM.evm.TU.scf_76.17   scf_76:125185-125781(-)
MQRMSGIATATSKMVEAVKGTDAKILDTRKTAPGLRVLDKWAVLIGGGNNHRMGLFDMVMIKDNHIAVAGGIKPAISRATEYLQQNELQGTGIEVETSSLDEVQEVLEALDEMPNCRVMRVMLDNMATRDSKKPGGVDTSLLREAVAKIDRRVDTEASGNVTLESVSEIASTGVTFISSGALTHSVAALDISLNISTS